MLVFMPLLAINRWRRCVSGLCFHACVRAWSSLWTQYGPTNCWWEFRQIYNFGALWDNCELIDFEVRRQGHSEIFRRRHSDGRRLAVKDRL